jgi:undecaprenyl diphosphate synthase
MMHNPGPRHVAIIMDGNGRWAKKRFMPRFAGHQAGVEAVRDIVKACVERKIEVLTLFAFSSENWRRPDEEVSLLMKLFMSALDREVKRLHKNGVRLRVVGDIAAFPAKLQQQIKVSEELTRDNKLLQLNIAANYGGRWDIVQACKKLARAAVDGEITVEQIDEQLLERQLSLAGLPEPDLFIRTGGEERISNFLLWQLAYSEFFFTATLWPDFSVGLFDEAIESFKKRQRRFGRTGDQVEQVETNA